MKTITFIGFFAVVLFGCAAPDDPNFASEETFCLDEKTKAITEIATLEKRPVIERIHLTGSIEANPDRVVHYVSLVDGVVSNTFFSLGDRVEKGDVLAELRSAELSALHAEHEVLTSRIEVATHRLDMVGEMYADGISSNRDVLEAQSELKIWESEKQKIENIMRLFSAGEDKDFFRIIAPASGIITAKNINPGTSVTQAGSPLFSISNLNDVWAMANIYSADIGRVKSGMEVEIKTLTYPDEVFKGKISGISQVLDQDAKVLKARIVLDNTAHKLKPGMIADITVLKRANAEEITIPTTSIVFFNNKNHVLVYGGDCDIAVREIALLTEGNGVMYVESGLEEHEKIIAKNHLLIFEAIQ